jgi:hypothetical protein
MPDAGVRARSGFITGGYRPAADPNQPERASVQFQFTVLKLLGDILLPTMNLAKALKPNAIVPAPCIPHPASLNSSH